MAADSPQVQSIPDTAAILPQLPQRPRPVLIIGAGGIVQNAHLPAYSKARFPVVGIVDQAAGRAESVANQYGVERAFANIDDGVRFAPQDVVFDIAVPASELVHVLPHLRDGSAVLMQKPMGGTLEEATAIREICRNKGLIAAVNFSLRYSPNHLAVRALADAGLLGAIHDIEVQVRTYTPWHLWSFLATAPRLEILYHSIHYFDLIRCWLGNPRSVAAKTVKSPHDPGLAATKTVAILDYGDSVRVFVATNHGHNFGPAHQHSFVQWEGMAGAARMTMGVYLDYPHGKPDSVEYAQRGSTADAWTTLPISGNYFPDGFIGPMAALQCFVEGSAATLPSHFEDAYQTMQLVEALYQSSESGGVPVAPQS